MQIVGYILFAGGCLGCILSYVNGKQGIISPEMFLSGIAVVTGALFVAIDHLSIIRTTLFEIRDKKRKDIPT